MVEPGQLPKWARQGGDHEIKSGRRRGERTRLVLGNERGNDFWELRRAMVRPGRDALEGIIKVDETFIGGERPGKHGRGAAGKALVVVSTEVNEDRIGRIRLRRVPDASGPSLEDAVQEAAKRSSTSRTDGWGGYSGLPQRGYVHEVVEKEPQEQDTLLPSCHRVASLLKRWLLGTHQGAVDHEHLDYYLDEFTFRFNRRKARHRGPRFYRLLQSAVVQDPVPYSELIKKPKPPE
jgi:transposase-like protein